MRANYWSCTKFSDRIRELFGITKKPHSETFHGWDEWNKSNKARSPIGYWITEELLDAVQKVIHYPNDTLHAVTYWINKRFINPQHIVKTTLPKGQYQEIETRMLFSMFQLLVDYVEIELSSGWYRDKNYKFPWYADIWPFRHFINYRNKEAGFTHLNWELTLVFNEDWGVNPEDETYGQPTHQSIKAKEVLELYHWWTEVRPNRPDPYEASGWNAHSKDCEFAGFGIRDPIRSEIHDVLIKIEQSYQDEDTVMMTRLVNIRQSLWT